VPLKVVVFAWRLFRDRLPTKDNLLRRGVINHDSRMCVAGVTLSNRLIIYFYIVIFLVLFGTWFIVGLASQWPTHFMCLIIFISLAFVVVSGRGGAQFYRLYGLQRCGKFGRKETTGCSKAKNAPFIRWLIGLSSSPMCDWRRSTLLFPSIYMVGGLVRSPCWA